MAGAAALPANLKAEMTEVAPARLAGTASMVSVLSPAQMSDDAAPAASHSSVRPATVPAAPMSATSTAQMTAPATVTEMRPTRSTSRPDGRPVTMPATPKPASTAPRALEPRPKLVAAAQRDEEAEAGDARVGGEGGRRQHADAAREHGAQARGLGVRRRARRRAAGRRPATTATDGGRQEGQAPVDLAEQAADRGRQRDRGGLHGGEGAHRPPEALARDDLGQARQQQRREEGVGRARRRPRDDEEPDRRRHRRGDAR